jgi:hypothetical protein
MKLEYSRQIFQQSSNINFMKSPSSRSRVVPWGLADMTKLVVAFHNVGKAPSNDSVPGHENVLVLGNDTNENCKKLKLD